MRIHRTITSSQFASLSRRLQPRRGGVDFGTLEIVNTLSVRTAALVASAAICFGTSIERIPTKKKGAGPLFQIHYGDKWGFMDRTGKIVIEPQFVDVSDFFDGLAKVVKRIGNDYKSCFIDDKGKTVISCTFDDAGDFSEGLAPVRVGRLWGYIDLTGQTVIAPRFQGAAEISDGLGRFLVWDRIQCSRQTYTKDDAPTYAFAMHDMTFHLTSGCFAEHQRFGYVDKKGQVVIKPEFFVADDFSEGLAAVRIEESATSKYAFIDTKGAIVVPPQFDQAYSFSEGLAAVETGFHAEGGNKVAGKWGFIDKSGKFVVSPRFELTLKFSEGLARASEHLGSWGFIDRTGRFVIAPKYSEAWDFSEGLAPVWSDSDGFAYIDRTGKPILWPKGGRWAFSDGLTVAGEHGKRVYVDHDGKIVASYEVNPGY